MSIETTLTLVTLPVELLYYIFDQLDINDILLSLRNVCTQFRAMTNTYNRYKVRYTSTSVKADIHRICRIIRPEHVMSMSLTNSHRYEISDRIELFFSLIDIHQFTHLHSLDLFDIDDNNLKNILQYIITVPTLKNLSIGIKYIENFSDQTVDLLSTVITTSGIHKLHLFSMNYMILKIAWSSKSKLEHLALDSCSSQQLCYILDHLPNLRNLSSDHYYSVKTDPIIFPSTVHRLTSLKLHSTGMTMNYLESLLSFTPSLVRLQLMNYFTIFDFLQRLSLGIFYP
ncbi:hypothetical protein I4U23_003994 [Adineta vaga]|nr:hypothetical protein I4U23_003994 [Adineta vaga]